MAGSQRVARRLTFFCRGDASALGERGTRKDPLGELGQLSSAAFDAGEPASILEGLTFDGFDSAETVFRGIAVPMLPCDRRDAGVSSIVVESVELIHG